MFDMITKLLDLLAGSEPAEPEDKEHAARVAISAILAEAAMADGVYAIEEQQKIGRILAQRFSLSDEEAAALRTEGQQAQSEAMDLVQFTRVVKEAVPFEERVGVIEAVWRVIYADGDRDYEESALVRKLCGLLYVPDREAGLARQRVVNGPPL